MAILAWDDPKDPGEEKDYAVQWSKMLAPAGDVLFSSLFTVTSGDVVIESYSFDADAARTVVWVSGGSVGSQRLVNTVTTTGGRTYEQTIKMKVKEK